MDFIAGMLSVRPCRPRLSESCIRIPHWPSYSIDTSPSLPATTHRNSNPSVLGKIRCSGDCQILKTPAKPVVQRTSEPEKLAGFSYPLHLPTASVPGFPKWNPYICTPKITKSEISGRQVVHRPFVGITLHHTPDRHNQEHGHHTNKTQEDIGGNDRWAGWRRQMSSIGAPVRTASAAMRDFPKKTT